MILRTTALLLATFLFLPSVDAMDPVEEEVAAFSFLPPLEPKDTRDEGATFQPVTVRIWESPYIQGKKPIGDHISLQTEKHYMSLRPSSNLIEDQEAFRLQEKKGMRTLREIRDSVAPSTFAIDQSIQNKKLHDKLCKTPWFRGDHFQTCPCDTFSLLLDPKPMDAMWEKLLENAEPLPSKKGYRLKNVMYVNVKKWAQGLMVLSQEMSRKIELPSADQPPILYFSAAKLMKGLLFQGKIYNSSIFSLEPPKYFKDNLRTIPNIVSCYEDVIKYNDQIRFDKLTIGNVLNWIRPIFQEQELLKIHRHIESRNMPYLNKCHESEIIKILFQEDVNKSLKKKLKEIHEYLNNLQKRYQEEQNYLSLSGWANSIWYKEWKK